MKLEGIIPPIITPLNEDESLDRAGLERLIEYQLEGGASGVFVLGSCGEGPALAIEVREELVRAASEQVKGRGKVLVGVSAVGTRPTVELARRLTKQGGDAIVAVSPYYFVHNQAEMVAHIEAVAKAVDVPTFVYNIPQMVKTIVEPESVARLAEQPEIIGIKDSQGDMARFQGLIEIKHRRPDFLVFQGAEAVAALSIARGGSGAVLGIGNVAPRLCTEMYEAASTGDTGRAWALQERLTRLGRVYSHGQWLPCIKTAVSLLGICGPAAAKPYAALDTAAVEAIRADLKEAELLG